MGTTVERVAGGNLHYDAMKAVLMGCTAFAVDSPAGPLHGRNLDWWTENGLLERFTLVTRFVGGSCGEFVTVGWPGFAGVLSGLAPGRFAVTLNAVISRERPRAAMPVVFLLRQVLEEAASFAEALAMSRDTPVASDSLLLLSGVRAGELAVIERTPTRAEVRWGTDGAVFATNDYRALSASAPGEARSELAATSCGRFDRMAALVGAGRPAAGRVFALPERPGGADGDHGAADGVLRGDGRAFGYGCVMTSNSKKPSLSAKAEARSLTEK